MLAYHKIGSPEFGGTWCPQRLFESHLAFLAHRGVPALDAAGLAHRLRHHAPATPAVVLTFDDAFEDFAEHAWPRLQRYRLPAWLFVITDYAGRRASWDLPLPGRRARHLGWSVLRDLADAGVIMGSHTRTHRDLRRLDNATLHAELHGSRRALEDRLGRRVEAVSYPFGRWDGRVRDAARAAGYRFGFAMATPRPPVPPDPWVLRRWGMYVTDGVRALRDRLDPGRPGYGFQDAFARGVGVAAGLAAAWSGRTGVPTRQRPG